MAHKKATRAEYWRGNKAQITYVPNDDAKVWIQSGPKIHCTMMKPMMKEKKCLAVLDGKAFMIMAKG